MAIEQTNKPSEMEMRSVTVLGSTGSIGENTIDLIRRSPGRFNVTALTANRNVSYLVEQAIEFKAEMAVVADESCYSELKEGLSGTGIKVAAGADAVVEAASLQSDFVMASIVGTAGLEPTFKAVQRGTTLGLANKECLVSAGDIMMSEIGRCDSTLIPVDSEHSAIYQVFDFDEPSKIDRIILTASGGPFRQTPLEEMANMAPEQAVAHPNWDMGAKISIDSATMMNKGLELIEAYHLFPVAEEQIEILVHPQSVVHSLVDYVDGSVLAQMGTPDMRTPISYALSWPARMQTPAERLRLEDIRELTFEAPDLIRFPALRLAREALKKGGCAPIFLNAANEIAVERFLCGKIGFLDIIDIVEKTLEKTPSGTLHSLSDVLGADQNAREIARGLL